MPGQLRYNNAPQPYLFDVSAAFRNAADFINTPLRHFGDVADKITTSIQNQNTNELYRYLASQYDPNNVQSINQALARAAGDNRFSNVGADTWRQATGDYRVRQSELLENENLALAKRAMDAYQNRINQEAANGSIAGLLAANNAGAQAMLDGKVRSDAIKYGEVDPLRNSASERALRGAQAGAARANAEAARARAQATRALAARTNLDNLNNDAYNWLGRHFYEQQLRNVNNPGSGQTDATTMADLVKQAEQIFGPNITNAVYKFYQNAKNVKGDQAIFGGDILLTSDELAKQGRSAAESIRAERALAQYALEEQAQERGANSFLYRNPSGSNNRTSDGNNAARAFTQALLNSTNDADASSFATNATDFMATVNRVNNQNNTQRNLAPQQITVDGNTVTVPRSSLRFSSEDSIIPERTSSPTYSMNGVPITSSGSTGSNYQQDLGMDTATANRVAVNNATENLSTNAAAQGYSGQSMRTMSDLIAVDQASATTALNNSLGTTAGAKVDAYFAAELNGASDAIVKEHAAQALGVDPDSKVITSNSVLDLANAIAEKYKVGDSYTVDTHEVSNAIRRGIQEYGLRPVTAAMAVADAVQTQWSGNAPILRHFFDKYDLEDSDINRNFRAASRVKNTNSSEYYAANQLYSASKKAVETQEAATQLAAVDRALVEILSAADAVGGLENLPKSLRNQFNELIKLKEKYGKASVRAAKSYNNIMNGTN